MIEPVYHGRSFTNAKNNSKQWICIEENPIVDNIAMMQSENVLSIRHMVSTPVSLPQVIKIYSNSKLLTRIFAETTSRFLM